MRKGFTLVELSIVLVIIGLLTGGILAGKSLIKNAKIHKITSTLSQYNVAISSFNTVYKAYPGDAKGFAAPGNEDGNINGYGVNGNPPCNGIYYGSEEWTAFPHLTEAEMLDTKYRLTQSTGCGGSASFNTLDGPFFELSGKAAQYYPRKSMIEYKNCKSPQKGICLGYIANAGDVNPIINKMGGSAVNNIEPTGKCVGGDPNSGNDEFIACNDSTAIAGYLSYELNNQ